jgi:hypothetical protein
MAMEDRDTEGASVERALDRRLNATGWALVCPARAMSGQSYGKSHSFLCHIHALFNLSEAC